MIAERGSHEILLAKNGIYADLYRKQQLDEAAEGISAEDCGEPVQKQGLKLKGGLAL
ncbi:hypothetical protein D3C75_1050540 [compost metagenome]